MKGRALRDGERLFLTLVVTVLREDSYRDCSRKQKEEGGVWETADRAERALRGSENRGEGRQRCGGKFSMGQRPL